MRNGLRGLGLLALVALAPAGCATMHARGNVASEEIGGRREYVDEIRLLGLEPGDVVTVNGAPARLGADLSGARQLANYRLLCEEANRIRPAGTAAQDCGAEATDRAVIRLDRRRAHAVRVVRGDRAATVTVRAGIRFKWIWLDGLFGPGALVAWAVDARSSAWREHRPYVDFRGVTFAPVGSR